MFQPKLDKYDIKILELLHSNSRISIKDISESIHLSQPSCAERVRKLESGGIIKQYTTVIDLNKLGVNMLAIVRVKPTYGHVESIEKAIKGMADLLWCYKITGEDCYIFQIAVASVSELEEKISVFSSIAITHTSIVKSEIISNNFISVC